MGDDGVDARLRTSALIRAVLADDAELMHLAALGFAVVGTGEPPEARSAR